MPYGESVKGIGIRAVAQRRLARQSGMKPEPAKRAVPTYGRKMPPKVMQR